MTIRGNGDPIGVLLYSSYTAITGWGVYLRITHDGLKIASRQGTMLNLQSHGFECLGFGVFRMSFRVYIGFRGFRV